MRTRRFRFSRPPVLALSSLLLIAALVLAIPLFKAQHTLTLATRQARSQSQLPFTLQPLDPFTLRSQNPGFTSVAAPASFTSGAFFAGDLYLTSPAGLFVYAPDGTLRQTFRVGLDLPTAPLGRILVARLRNSTDPQLLIATAGAGLLLFTPGPHPTFAQLLPADPAARALTDLLPTPAGDLLLGTRDRGLLVFNGLTLTPYPMEVPGLDPAHLSVTALAASGSSILIGTRTAGLLLAQAGTVEPIPSLPDPQVESITVSASHAFVGTPLGIADLDLAAPTTAIRTLAPGLFTHALLATGDTLFAGTVDQGIQPIPLRPGRPHLRAISLASSQPTAPIAAFLTDGPETYALAASTVLLRTPTGWSTILTAAPAALTDPNISALAFAPDGRLFVGFFDRGLDILRPDTLTPDLTPESHLEDDHLFCINRLALDPIRQTIAAATANGLVLFDSTGHPRQTLTRRDGLISDHINDLAFTPTGLAVATPAGLSFLDPSGITSLYAFGGLVNNHVYTLGLSPDPTQLLAGTLGGLSLLTSGRVTRNLTATNSALAHNWITAVAPAQPSGWLLGTYGVGLQRLAPDGSFSPIELPPGTPRDLVINPNALLVTPYATYAGTLGHGLLVLSAGRWSLVTRGLPSLNVTAFAARAGTLFVGTENGLVRIPEATLAAALAGGPH